MLETRFHLPKEWQVKLYFYMFYNF
jgi:hypothetical protein